uniref:Uncharacterized protein n=1 Tax=Aromatoleum buckelii TaxID=200254 RepID=A0ABX1N6H9_9RHOO
MSYIIAFVSFEESNKKFPVQCFRTDIKLGDKVVVRRTDGKLRFATIEHLKYLNWDCNGRIECRKDESTLNADGDIVLPNDCPLIYGISTADVFVKELKSIGWVPVKSRQRMYRTVLANLNASNIAYIFVRKNGLDIQILPRPNIIQIKPYTVYDKSLTEGKVVRHSLAHTTFNLFEGVLRFSNSFLSNGEDLERYFVPQGFTDRRTEELKNQAKQRESERNHYDFGDIGDYPDDMYMGYHMK